jgi:hypothetical protein
MIDDAKMQIEELMQANRRIEGKINALIAGSDLEEFN